MEYDQRQEIRITRSIKKYFLDLGEKNISEYIRNLIETDLIKRRDADFIKNQIKQKKQEIKELEDLLISPHPMMEQINLFFKEQASSYKKNAPHRTTEQKHRFIKDVILPKLKKYGYKASIEEIDQILVNFPDNGGD